MAKHKITINFTTGNITSSEFIINYDIVKYFTLDELKRNIKLAEEREDFEDFESCAIYRDEINKRKAK